MGKQKRIDLLLGDITTLEVDAIVNAANSSLMGGGGVDGAIHTAAGPQLLDECKTLGGCPVGEAKITKGYNLKAKHVIHTVGPIWRDGTKGEPELLRNAYKNSLALANKKKLKTIAFPNISTGVYRFPKRMAGRIAINTVSEFLSKNSYPKQAIFVCFDETNYNLYTELLAELI
ncbi:MAG TPA: O-acetyl-ADP-ribose deacetylase [Bacteroidetes bacterium]|nr:O-acetyl-ADP-ribose deacetylase [Bacteroidota bacterium]